MFNFITIWRQERATIRELARLSDRELDDIGIARGELKAAVRRSNAGSSSYGDADELAPSWGNHLRRAVTQ